MPPRCRPPSALVIAGVVVIGLLGGCPLSPAGGGGNGGGDGNEPGKTFHEKVFTELVPAGYQGPSSCQFCHSDVALDLRATGHWNWSGRSVNILGHAGEQHGKKDLLDSFFIGVPSNEGRCSQCHISYGWQDRSFDFDSTARMDCLICHDATGTYAKHPTADGGGGHAALVSDGRLTPVGPEDLQAIVYRVALPARANCGACHFYADDGDNVKHGDLSSDLANPSRELDVHMGGLDFACQTCHTQKRHGLAGFTLHSVDEGGEPPACTRCHGETNVHQANPPVDDLINPHLDRVACETCHIPRFARSKPTRVAWYWDTAGQDVSPIPTDEFGLPTYDKEKGTFVWAKNVRPEYRWHNGIWRRMIVGVADTYASAGTVADPVVVAEPAATKDDPGAKIYPFKKMVGRQPADIVHQRLLVPHLFGAPGGPDPFWEKFDWGDALLDGAIYNGVDYSGAFGFPDTVMYLQISHEVAPREMALQCNDCHGVPSFWDAVGLRDPLARLR